MIIKRMDGYADGRFSQSVLNQHGAYLIDGKPYEVEIVDQASAVIRGGDPAAYEELIETFRFYTEHIYKFYDTHARLIAEYPAPELFDACVEDIQPSQFFVDEDKLMAVRTFIRRAEDVVVPVIPYGDRYISLDGHTRLYLAVQRKFQTVKAVMSETDDWIWTFVHEAQRRNIQRPGDLTLLPHKKYEAQWYQYCDDVFAGKE